jgi:hypothetical protein
MQRYGEELFYDGTTGRMIPSTIFVGNVYTMRLKHMVEDKWNARGEGRREQRTHQPTGGRGNQGGLRIGEMERDALIGHGITQFLRESLMKRSDGTVMTICNGCGTVPIYNEKEKFVVCSLCDGPVQFVGTTSSDFELLPTLKRSIMTTSKVEIPYSLEVLNKELATYMNMSMRMLTAKDIKQITKYKLQNLSKEQIKELLNKELEAKLLPDLYEPKVKEEEPKVSVTDEQLEKLGANSEILEEKDEEEEEVPKITVEEAKKIVDAHQATLNAVNSDKGDEQIYEDVDDISVVQSVVQSQPQQVPYVLMPLTAVAPPMAMVQSQIPNAPATLVVDTSRQAMEAQGFPEPNQIKTKSILKRPNSPSRFSKSAPQTGFTVNKLDNNISEASSVPSNTKVTIIKEGQ